MLSGAEIRVSHLDRYPFCKPIPSSHSQAYKEKLIALLKKEVKHIMEESVMLKSIHEDSATVTSLCAVVDTCLSLGKEEWNRSLDLYILD